jgi:hypothetical protein
MCFHKSRGRNLRDVVIDASPNFSTYYFQQHSGLRVLVNCDMLKEGLVSCTGYYLDNKIVVAYTGMCAWFREVFARANTISCTDQTHATGSRISQIPTIRLRNSHLPTQAVPTRPDYPPHRNIKISSHPLLKTRLVHGTKEIVQKECRGAKSQSIIKAHQERWYFQPQTSNHK